MSEKKPIKEVATTTNNVAIGNHALGQEQGKQKEKTPERWYLKFANDKKKPIT